MSSLFHMTIAEIAHGVLGVLFLAVGSALLLGAATLVVLSLRTAHAQLSRTLKRRGARKPPTVVAHHLQPGNLLPES